MNAAQQGDIERLWAAYGGTSSSQAPALQLAIWLCLGDGSLGYNVSSTDLLASEANTMLTSVEKGGTYANIAGADLVALVSPQGQNYIVAVPEPATIMAGMMLFVPFGVSMLRILRKHRTA
jgi:hypothetical protein